MGHYLESLFLYVKEIIGNLGYLGIAGGMLIESACIPLPSEVVLPLAGFMVADGKINLWLANLAVAVGSLSGSLLAYAVGYYGGRPLILKYGKYFFVSENKFQQAEKTFNKHGAAAVLFSRLLPVVRTFISLPAGIAKMNPGKFILFSLIGMLPWNFALIFLGYTLGQQYDKIIHPIFQKFEYVVVGLIVIVILFLVVRTLFRKRDGNPA